MSNCHNKTDEATSKKMRAVRQAGTKPELAVRDALKSLSVSFDVNVKDKPGSPDIWTVRNNTPIFVHGCFWHQHEGCKKATMPKTNRDYWTKKFLQNRERDARKIRELSALGYTPVIIWQCQTTCESALRRLLATIVLPREHSCQ